VALLTLKGRNEDKVRFTAEHLRRELERRLAGWKWLTLAGPAPAPLLRAETFYRYQLMLRTRQMSRLSPVLAAVRDTVPLPDDLTLVVDVDPVNLL
jgi:primosomal protein N' (replication factor Y)